MCETWLLVSTGQYSAPRVGSRLVPVFDFAALSPSCERDR